MSEPPKSLKDAPKSLKDGGGPPKAIATPCIKVCVVDGESGLPDCGRSRTLSCAN